MLRLLRVRVVVRVGVVVGGGWRRIVLPRGGVRDVRQCRVVVVVLWRGRCRPREEGRGGRRRLLVGGWRPTVLLPGLVKPAGRARRWAVRLAAGAQVACSWF